MPTPVHAPAPAHAPATGDSLLAVRKDAADAAQLLKHSATVPPEVALLVGDLGRRFDADTVTMINPHLSTELWHVAYTAANALQIDDEGTRRIELRAALEQMLAVLDELVDDAPFGPTVPIKDVLERTADLLSVPQDKLAELLGVSTRTLQRWLAGQAEPGPEDDARVRIVGQLANQLRHTFTRPGIYAWFYREHPQLRGWPVDLLKDPLSYPQLLMAAASVRSMSI